VGATAPHRRVFPATGGHHRYRDEFRLDELLPGIYNVVATANGFTEATSDVRVTIGSLFEMTVTLKPLALKQTVTVADLASSITTQPIDTASAVNQAVFTSQDLDTISLAARSFANIAYLAPGTEPVESSDPTKARITAVSDGSSSGLWELAPVEGRVACCTRALRVGRARTLGMKWVRSLRSSYWHGGYFQESDKDTET
jgi:hypothetical protein